MLGFFNNLMFSYKKNYTDNAKAVIIIVHGICEHSKRYLPITNYLNKSGYSVIRYDQRGHGETGGVRGKIDGYYELVEDLDQFVNMAKKDYPNKPIFLIGHSMGGLVVSLYSLKYQEKLNGVISSGGANGIVPVSRLLNFFPWKWFKNKSVKNFFPKNALSSDDNVEKNYWNDPLNLKEYKISLAGYMFNDGAKHLKKNYHKITIPYLFLHGKKDLIVPFKISVKMHNKISSKDKNLYLIKNSPHEIFNEPNKEDTYKIIINWLNERI